ncbi:MAG: hypothetical protein IPI34_13660 [bacterium]|nr:hypothetical protein [bacterium]
MTRSVSHVRQEVSSIVPLATITIADNTLMQWGMAFILAAGVSVALRLIQAAALKRLAALAAGTTNIIDDALVDAIRATKGLTSCWPAWWPGRNYWNCRRSPAGSWARGPARDRAMRILGHGARHRLAAPLPRPEA